MRVAPENIAFMCAVACIRTAEYARNCEASERFLAKMRSSNFDKFSIFFCFKMMKYDGNHQKAQEKQ